VGHAPILHRTKLLRCIGLHAYPTGVAARNEGQTNKNYENQQQTITALLFKKLCPPDKEIVSDLIAK